MATKEDKKENIRNGIIASAHAYRNDLAGRVFLYVSENLCFEVEFRTGCFQHLTGVCTKLKAEDFYKKAKSSMLTLQQFAFDANHPYDTARKKLSCLSNLSLLTNSLVCVVENLNTYTLSYKLGVSNLDFTIGLTEDIGNDGRKKTNHFLPRTLRIKDNSIERSASAEFVDFIFSKEATQEKYDTLMYQSKAKCIPTVIFPMLSDNLIELLT